MVEPAKIDKPGVYELTNEQYHGDCCVTPSLSSSGAHKLVDQCPAAFWWNSPLNPQFAPENKTAFDLGTAAHTALLEPATWESRIQIVDAKDYRTDAAKEARDAAWAAGKTPLLPHQRVEIFNMREALLAHPIASKAWEDGKAEPSYIWRDEKTGVFLKCRPDHLPNHHRWIVDYKSTTNANPRAFIRRIFDMGYFQSAAWYIDGVVAVDGCKPPDWFFVVQENTAPYLVSVLRLTPQAIEWGRILNRRAIDLFAACLETDTWPGYGEKAVEVGLPSYAEFQLEERHEAGEFKPAVTKDLKQFMMEAYAP